MRFQRRSTLRWYAASTGLLIATPSSSVVTPPVRTTPNPRYTVNAAAVDEYVAARMQKTRIPGLALVIVTDDTIAYLKAYGRADPTGRAVTPQTPFIIGSITKSFTALAIMQLVEAGKVELDAPVQRYLSWFSVADPNASGKITVRELLYQTSGISQSSTLDTWTWRDEADSTAIDRHVRLLATAPLIGAPGKTFAYANANYATLGALIQAVSGETYEDYIAHHIFAPLDMQHSYTSQAEAERHGLASGHRWWFGFPIAATLPFSRANLPAGFIISTAEDMAHYAIAQLNGGQYRGQSILSAAGIAASHKEPTPHTYAMGWETIALNGRRLVNHDGGTANYQTSLFMDPEARVGVFIAANAISALDAFSSPHGSSVLDGSTVRAMAQTVLTIVTNQPRPDQGPRLERLTVVYDSVLAALTLALIVSLAWIPARYRRWQRDAALTNLEVKVGLTALLHFAWPLALWYATRTAANWVQITMFQPDLVYWLYVVAAVVVAKGLLEIVLLWRARHGPLTPSLAAVAR